MAKINILFDEKNYSIDEANLAPATNALKAHLETLKEQGVPKFGTDWKFKDIITIDEMKQVAAHYTPDEQGMHTIYWNNPSGIQILIMDLDTLLPQMDPGFVPEGKMGTVYEVVYKPNTTYSGDIWFYFDRSELTDYGYEIFSQGMPAQVPISQDQLPGWFLAENQEVVKTGPTMPAVSESSGINLEYVAPLFDVPGNEGDLDITLDGAVYKVDSTKLAPATNSLIAHLETLKGGEGGGLVEGETYTFKTNLSGINPTDFMKTQVGSGPLDGQQYAIAMLGNYALTYLTSDACDYMYMRGEDTGACPNGAWTVTDLTSQQTMISYLYPITLRNPEDGEIVDNPGHWIYAEYRNSSSIKDVDPISITIPSPFDASVGGYSLDELAVFFDIPSTGGTLKFGEEVQFKDIITKADVEAYVANATPSETEEGSATYDIFNSGNETPFATMGVGTGTNWAIITCIPSANLEEATEVYMYAYNAEKLVELFEQPFTEGDGWYSMGSKGVSKTSAPKVVIRDTYAMSAGLATTAVLFDLGGGAGNEGDTKIVINGAEYFVDSAKLADAKSALAAHFKALEDASN